jgi:hypothetical protein
MSTRFSLALPAVMAIVVSGILAGCSQATRDQAGKVAGNQTSAENKGDYNPHDAPITEAQKTELRQQVAQFPVAIAKVKELRDGTERETKDGIPENPYQAHQALDKADLLLQWLPEIARDSGVAKEHWEVVATTANDLRTLFEQVHQNIDNQRNPNFAGVAAEIDLKIAELEKISK